MLLRHLRDAFAPAIARGDTLEHDDIESIVNSAARMALEGIVATSYTPAERERLEHAALTGEWTPPPSGS
jgi:hypothetical protein